MDTLQDYIIINQDNIEQGNLLKIKIFNYFYYLLNVKNFTYSITLVVLHTIEMMQLISFAFSDILLLNWNMQKNISTYLKYIVEGFRLVPIFSFTSYNTFLVVFFICFIIVIILFICLILQILYFNENSKISYKLLSLTQSIISYLTIFLFIPFTELFLIPFKCENNKLLNNEIECWKNMHLVFAILGIIGEIIFFCFVYFLNYFYFYPFIVWKTTIKLNSDVDLLLIKIKLIYEIQYIFIKNHEVSMPILLFLSIYLVYYNLNKKVYVLKRLEIFINLRNALVCWSFIMLLISRICLKSNFNNSILLLILCYPIIIFGFIMYYIRKENQSIFTNNTNNDINTCLSKIKILIILVKSFIEEKKSRTKLEENFNQKNEILLKGIIQIHTENCLKQECPLTQFIKNEGNFITQKQCLLNYMTIFFNNAMRQFPNDILIRMYYIQFNYDQKYNLNSVRATLEDIKRLRINLHSKFILYCQEKTISNMQLNDNNEVNEEEKEKLILEHNYKRLKNLISNITKLYAEFWGIFSANITNNLNTAKLYTLGEKINAFSKEMNLLWKNNLRNKKINYENQNIAQLFSKFLKEILWDSKKSEAVQKKINEEQYLQEYNKTNDEKKLTNNNINSQENQDFIIYVSSNEKGNCNIIQFSNSLSYIIGYQKHELINKPLDILMPSMLSEGHPGVVENFIKSYNNIKNLDKDYLNENIRKTTFILIKNKMGYLIPFNAKFTLFDDNDFSNSFILKAKLESPDIKSLYPFYLLVKPDFTLDGFSSSAIHLGLTMDLLKKYVINLNFLIRTGKDKSLNLEDVYQNCEDNEKIVTWVFPDFIYPKDDNYKNKNKDKTAQDLINISKKIKLHLQIFELKYKENIINGFVFKLFESKNIKNKKKNINQKSFIPDSKTQIVFDLLNLNYIRTVIVKKKSGFRNLRISEEDKEKIDNKNNNKKTKRKNQEKEGKELSSEDELNEVIITKEKILELQSKDSIGIKSFINMLPFFGKEISLVKHRPNKELYPAGKAQEPSIKIVLNDFIKRIEKRIRDNPNFFKKIKSAQKAVKLSVNDNNLKKNENINNELKQQGNIEKDISGNPSFSLSNVININSLNIIKYIDFLIYLFTITSLIIEFILTYNFFSDNTKRFSYFRNSFVLLNDLTYIKYYVTEGILSTNLNYYIMSNNSKEKTYINQIQNNLKEYLVEINDIISQYENPDIKLSKEYINYVSNAIIPIRTINNNEPKIEYHPYISAKTKLTNALFQISSSKKGIDFNDKYAYELMINLLNSYYLSFEKIITIMFNDLNENTKKSGNKNIIIFLLALLWSIIYLIIFYKLLLKLDLDREKPINLFLTIKNTVFEDLKNTAENFSNKLLNNFFGVEETEEESQKDFQTNIKPKDINIAKFNALNDNRINNNQGTSFMFYFIQLSIFYAIVIFIFLFKYINTLFYYDNIEKFIRVYNYTYFSEIYLVSTIDIMKQYFYNVSIVNYGFTEETQIFNFLIGYLRLSTHISNAVQETSETDCFLKDNYLFLFKKYYYGNFTELINSNDPIYKNYSSEGFKALNLELIEQLKYLYLDYFIDNRKNITNLNSSDLINDKRWIYIDSILFTFLRPWYRSIFKIIDKNFYDYVFGKQSSVLLLFVLMIIVISFYYWVIWKRYEKDFINSIERSFELINLMPEEIKNVIAGKLNESS